MANADAVVSRLLASPDHVDALVQLLGDHLFRRPLEEVVDPAQVAAALAGALKASVEDPDTARWLRARVQVALAPRGEGAPLKTVLPVEVVDALKAVLRRPYRADPELLKALLDHPAMRKALRSVLEDSLIAFAAQAASLLPDTRRLPGGRGLSHLVGMAKGVAGAVTGEVNKVLEGRVGVFVDQVIGHAAQVWIDALGSERLAPDMGEWRADLVDVLLDQPVDRYRQQLRRMDPERGIDDLTGVLRALAGWDGLLDAVESTLRELLAAVGHKSVAEVLAGSGLEDSWRREWEALTRPQVESFLASPGLRAWLDAVLVLAEEPAG